MKFKNTFDGMINVTVSSYEAETRYFVIFHRIMRPTKLRLALDELKGVVSVIPFGTRPLVTEFKAKSQFDDLHAREENYGSQLMIMID